MRVFFLYTELADYIRKCFEALAQSGVEVHVVAYPINPEAPFNFDLVNSEVNYYDRESRTVANLDSLLKRVNPDAIFCSGWIDSAYNKLLEKWKNKTTTILISDNAYEPNPKSMASVFRAKLLHKHRFSKAFVAGPPQVEYARKMGFKDEEIGEGFYTADVAEFSSMINPNFSDSFPKRLVFVGRYLDFKGVFDMWRAFSEMNNDHWELHCYGTGAEWERRQEHPKIFHHGFIQPSDFEQIVRLGGIFVLPSLREPWGVVVHEFAAAGFPLILSDKVNSGRAFLSEKENGVSFKAGSVSSLKIKMTEMLEKTSSELRQMAESSKTKAARYTIDRWVSTALNLVNNQE